MKIILGVDASKYSNWAVDLLLKLPLIKEPEVYVMHVVDLPVFTQPLIAPPLAKQYREAMRKEIDRRLGVADQLTDRVVKKIRNRWKKVQPIIEKGPIAEKIVARAREEGTDLIILGSRGLSNIQRFLLGSVSQKVVTYAPCSVLVVKGRARAIKTFLLAVDGSKPSEAAMQFLKSHFIPEKLWGTVLFVWDYPIHPHPDSLLLQMLTEKYCQPLMQAGFRAKAHYAMGHPAVRIVKAGQRRKMDLMVIGSRGLTGLKKFFLGGISHKVVKYSSQSVLVVR
jgi:nucleotide-binding universal stress UspA family protein